MLTFLQRYFWGIHVLSTALLGIALGYLCSTLIGLAISPAPGSSQAVTAKRAQVQHRPLLTDYQTILQRNIFDSTAKPISLQDNGEEAAVAAEPIRKAAGNLHLLGTVAAGPDSLAVISDGKETAVYRLDEKVPGGGKLADVERFQATLEYSDGSQEILTMEEEAATPAARRLPSRAGGSAIKEVGNNRWEIPKEEADKARNNLGELLKSARMEPLVVNGQTQGFVVKMIRPRSLLANLGLQRGDIIKEINGTTIDSPEKALQIFQQLREARRISVGLQRGKELLSFEYEVN